MWLNKNSKENVSIQKIIGAIVLVSLVILITSFFTGSNQLFSKLSSANKLQAFYSLNFSERFLLQWPVLLISCFALWLLVKKKAAASLIVLLVFAEIFIVTQFNIPVTAIGVRSFDEVEVILNRNKEAFPLPNNASIAENINGYPTSPDSIVSNPLLFAKEIGRNDVFITPGNLMAQDSFYYSAVRTESFKKPVAYLLNSPINDSIKITAMGADFFEIKTNTQSNALMVLQQNYYPGWKAFVNDKEVAVEIINITEMMVKLPAGKNVTRLSIPAKMDRICHFTFLLSASFCYWRRKSGFLFQNGDQRNTSRKTKLFKQRYLYSKNSFQDSDSKTACLEIFEIRSLIFCIEQSRNFSCEKNRYE